MNDKVFKKLIDSIPTNGKKVPEDYFKYDVGDIIFFRPEESEYWHLVDKNDVSFYGIILEKCLKSWSIIENPETKIKYWYVKSLVSSDIELVSENDIVFKIKYKDL